MKLVEDGTITTPSGFSAAAVSCGLKSSGGLDLAIVHSQADCSAARASQTLTAKAVDCLSDQVLVLSTGVIGVPLNIEKMAEGIAVAGKQLSPENGSAAARAIMTTDTQPKHLAARIELASGWVTLGGMAKGSGMIHPDMATMLAVLTTDAAVSPQDLDYVLRRSVDRSFHRISIDGDTSTNDTVLILANGASGIRVDERGALEMFAEGVEAVCGELARKIVRDGEGASKFITLVVSGARTEAEAVTVGRVIATSPLVKTAFAGGDPNWGRIVAAAGRSGVEFDPDRLALWVAAGTGGGIPVVT